MLAPHQQLIHLRPLPHVKLLVLHAGGAFRGGLAGAAGRLGRLHAPLSAPLRGVLAATLGGQLRFEARQSLSLSFLPVCPWATLAVIEVVALLRCPLL